MHLNLVILQPPGYIYSLCFLESARYLRHHLRAHGIEAQISKNRPRHGMVNVVFGAHLGVPKDWNQRFCCVWFNQEQIGEGGASLPPAYLQLLATANVIDYDTANVAAYPKVPRIQATGASRLIEVMPLLNAPFLQPPQGSTALQDRPIDLLFFGSTNDERLHLIERIERCGVSVARFDHPMFGPERDEYIAQSKAVLNLPFYGSNRFEQVRAFNALSVGTPVVSLRRHGLAVEPAHEQSIHWFQEEDLEPYFTTEFGTPDWIERSSVLLNNWRSHDPTHAMARLASELKRLDAQHRVTLAKRLPVRPVTHLNLQGRRHYRPDWLNASPNAGEADAVLDLSDVELPDSSLLLHSEGETWRLTPGGVHAILAEQTAAQSTRLQNLISNACILLRDGGQMVLECPLGIFGKNDTNLHVTQQLALTQVRAALDEHLAAGGGNGALTVDDADDIQETAADQNGSRHTLRVHLRKRECSPREQVLRRSARLDFGSFPEDTEAISAAGI